MEKQGNTRSPPTAAGTKADKDSEKESSEMIEIFEKERYYDDSTFTGQCYMYPTYMRKDGKEYFMFNRREPDDAWQLQANEDRKAFLIANGGKYFKFNGFYDDPFEMLEEIKERKHTFSEPENKIYACSFEENGFIDFRGNRREVSAAFHYRIYDREMAEKIQEIVHGIYTGRY